MACYMLFLLMVCLFSNAIGHPTDQSEGRSAQGVGIGTGIGVGGNANANVNIILHGNPNVHSDGNNIHINAGSRCSDASWRFDRSSGLCYTIIEQDLTWVQAESACRARGDFHGGAELTFIRNQQEQQFIKTNLLQTRSFCNWWENGCSVWIGLRDTVGNNRHYEWTSNFPVTYTNWMAGEPNTNYEKCVAQQTVSPYLWWDADCNEKRPALCVKKGI